MTTQLKISIIGYALVALSLLGAVKIVSYLYMGSATWRVVDSSFDLFAYAFLAYPFLFQKWNSKLYGANAKIPYYITAGLLGFITFTLALALPPVLNALLALTFEGSLFQVLSDLEISQPWYTFLASIIIYPIGFSMIVQRDVRNLYLNKFEAGASAKTDFEYEQLKAGYDLKFNFEEKQIIFYMKTPDSVNTYETSYEDVRKKQSEITQKNDWFRNVGVLWLGIGVYLEVLPMVSQGEYHTPLWTTLGVICLGVFYLRQIKFTVVEADGKNNILVIQDTKHDEIIEKIYSERNKYMKDNYGKVNPQNDPEAEIRKFEFMKKDEVITNEEYDEAVKKIREFYKEGAVKSPLSPK